MKKVILIGMLALTVEASALGVHSKELLQQCTGTIKATNIEKVGVGGGIHDRAGNYHPPSGYAYINYELQELGKGCAELEEAYGLDLKTVKFEKHHAVLKAASIIGHSAQWPPAVWPAIVPDSFQIEEKDVFKAAKELIGKVYAFELKHHISHQQKDGFLPFYPLVHNESFQLETEGIGSLDLKVKKEKQKLNLSDHEELANAFFDFIDSEESEGFYIGLILNTLLQQAPLAHHTYLQGFVPKVIELYEAEELNFDSAKQNYQQSDQFKQLVKFLKKISHQHNWKSKLSKVDFVLKHPSLFYSMGYLNESCLNIDAIYLEDFMEEIEFALFDGKMTEQTFKNWEKPLKEISGSSSPKSCLSKLSSKYAKSIATDLLEEYY